MILALILVPVLGAFAAFLIRPDGPRRFLLMAAAMTHSAFSSATWWIPAAPAFGGWLELDAIGKLFLSITSLLFLITAAYGVGYLKREAQETHKDPEEGFFFADEPEAIFTGCLLLFLASMTLVMLSRHFGLLWVAVEATTLASAPLIFFHRHHRSLEATWKYLVICSVGIALALLGNFFLAIASPSSSQLPLTLRELLRSAPNLNVSWLKAAFLFLLVGYGTKMGLAPLHTWLPDAHSEAPSVVSALLSGALLNCAFVGILRIQQVCLAAGQGVFAQQLLVLFGLLSMGIAAFFIINQDDYKRMLAYSSVEHMGILALGVGLSGGGTFGAMLHAVNHSLTKAMLFLVAGNVLAVFRTKSTSDVRGILRCLPGSGILWIAGFLAITGSPPFGPFLSEFTILKAAIDQKQQVVAVLYLFFLALIFVGMASIFLKMAQGVPSSKIEPPGKEPILAVAPPAVLGILVLILGIYIPPALHNVILQAAVMIGGR